MRQAQPQPSVYERVTQHDGRQFDLYAPRWMHAVNGRVLKGTPVNPTSLVVSYDQVIIPEASVVRVAPLVWDGSTLVEQDGLAWSEQ